MPGVARGILNKHLKTKYFAKKYNFLAYVTLREPIGSLKKYTTVWPAKANKYANIYEQ